MTKKEHLIIQLHSVGTKTERIKIIQELIMDHYADDPVLMQVAWALDTKFDPKFYLSQKDQDRYAAYECFYSDHQNHEEALLQAADFCGTSEEAIKKSLTNARKKGRTFSREK